MSFAVHFSRCFDAHTVVDKGITDSLFSSHHCRNEPYLYINKNVTVCLFLILNLQKFFTDCFEILTQRCIRIRAFFYIPSVACSRVGKPDNLYICTDNGTTKNIVYPQAL
jgi:hypothetical protein